MSSSEYLSRSLHNGVNCSCRSQSEPLESLSSRSPPFVASALSSRSPPFVASALTDLLQASVAPFQESFIPFREFPAASTEFFGGPQHRCIRQSTGRKHLREFDDEGPRAHNPAGKRRRKDLRSGFKASGVERARSETSELEPSGLEPSGLESSGSKTSGLAPSRGSETSGSKTSVLEPSTCDILTEGNLRKLEYQFDEHEDMDKLRTKGEKRSQSHLSMTQASDVYSQKSSCTAAIYRWNILDRARISVNIGPLPEEIQGQFDPIFKRKIPKDRKLVLHQIAKDFVDDFTELDGARRENDCMRPFEKAFAAMDHDKKFYFPTFADWELCIKPRIGQDSWVMKFRYDSQSLVEDSATRPRKRQQTDTSYPSPDNSAVYAAGKVDGRNRKTPISKAVEPPPPNKNTSPIKTPRPDITMAFRHETVVDKMLSKGTPNETMASDYLKMLQRDQEVCSNPTQHPIPIRFAVLVVEGKSYATGKTVFEAQNQASVSGSCINNQQHQLADFAKDASGGSSHSKVLPTGFSICTEGPHIESWGHYTREEHGIRKYKMNIINTCYATLLPGVVSFFQGLDKIRSWALDTLLDDIGEQLAASERAVRVGPERLGDIPNNSSIPTTSQGLCA